MSDRSEPTPAKSEEFRLRGRPPRVTRLSRKMLVAGGALAALAIVVAVTFAMRGGHGQPAKPELFATDAKPPADALANLPRDYAGLSKDVPKLGPPLPGDLGRPILNARTAGVGEAAGDAAFERPMAASDPASQRLAQTREAARGSGLFTGRGGAGEVAAILPVVTPPDGIAAPVNGDHRLAFLNAAPDRETTSAHRLQAPASPYVLQSGAVIAAALVTGIRSDLPGQVIAQVTENVYDSPTGRVLLVPQGSRLVGTYDSQVEFGQSRVLLAWTRLILPGGRSILLDRQPAGDSQGFAGLQDGVDHHWRRLASAAVLSTLLGVGTQLGAGADDSDVLRALRQGAANSVSQVGQQVVAKALDVQPTLTIRPGASVRVLITRDLVLEPFGT